MTASANLELVRSIYEAWGRGDFSSADWADPEIEFRWADGPDPGGWRGVASLAGAMRDHMSAWEDLHLIADEYRNLDDERVLVLSHRSGRGKTSGLEIGQFPKGGAVLFHLHHGEVTRIVVYFDRDRAFADLGLSPEGDANDQAD